MKRWLFLFICVVGGLLPARAQQAVVERNGQGVVVRSTHGVYDSDGRLAVTITYEYDSSGVVVSRTLQSYSKEGRPVFQEVYSVDDYLLYSEENRYDGRGNRIRCRQVSYDEDGSPVSSDFRYRYFRQDDGRWQVASIRLNGKVVYRHGQ